MSPTTPAGRVAVVTDSTASLPDVVPDGADVVVVPLHVVVDGTAHLEGVDLTPARLVAALRAGAQVTTSQPGPEAFARAYSRAAARGAREVVSVHLSAELSGTVTSAAIAAQTSPVPVHVVDSRSVGMGLGFPVLTALAAARAGEDGAAVARAAERRAATTSVLFAVDTLEHLRRGGRLGPVAAAVGTVLGLRPVLGVRDGRIEVVEKVRTSARARTRLVELVADGVARRGAFDLAVHHLGDAASAEELGDRLRASCGPGLRDLHVAEISAVVGAHVGPGVLAVVAADH
ncbi:DegV family protein [Actinotalea solisilvae]|uniref:DegV family protein n=1 Tax=Actinotalea solisilvae TaxID=2072922 RepID=UPI0018F16F21|nr:DegV family protein [Actinotalea solisilvae]